MNVIPGVEVSGLTDVGCQRDNNEDSYLYWEPSNPRELELKGRLAVIADGMGVHEGGSEASRLAVETVRETYDKQFRGDPEAALVESFAAAHAKIREFAERYPVFHGMGTTCTALVLQGDQLYFVHVGDSRLYLIRGENIRRLTRDHSYVGRLVESGLVRPEDAEKHPQRHILTAALGAGMELAVERSGSPLALQAGDHLLLCTDGLWSVVSDEEIAAALKHRTLADGASSLIKLARERGGPDNITVQLLYLQPKPR
jgi:PPM family protein phosphatase